MSHQTDRGERERVTPDNPKEKGNQVCGSSFWIRVKVIKGKFMFFSGLGVEDDVWAGSLHPCHSSQVG